jgi:ribosome biogenesis protein Tsr3
VHSVGRRALVEKFALFAPFSCAFTGYVKTIHVGASFQGLVLSPAGEQPVSFEDRVCWEFDLFEVACRLGHRERHSFSFGLC